MRFHVPFCELQRVLTQKSEPDRKLNQQFLQCGTSWSAIGLPVSLLNVPVSLNFFSSLLMLLFGHHLFGNLFTNSPSLYIPSTTDSLIHILIKIFSSSLIRLQTHFPVTSAMYSVVQKSTESGVKVKSLPPFSSLFTCSWALALAV